MSERVEANGPVVKERENDAFLCVVLCLFFFFLFFFSSERVVRSVLLNEWMDDRSMEG